MADKVSYTAIDWFYGICYVPKLLDSLRQANPAITDERLSAVFGALPALSEDELSDTSSPSHRIVDISLDKTSSYFDMGSDYLDRPHELSVACFRKEVLSKYNVHVEGASVRCPDWGLRDVFINNAGQVHVCVCDLRDLLSEEEQLHWKTHNVRPDMEADRGTVAPPFHGMARGFVRTCLFNAPPEGSAEDEDLSIPIDGAKRSIIFVVLLIHAHQNSMGVTLADEERDRLVKAIEDAKPSTIKKLFTEWLPSAVVGDLVGVLGSLTAALGLG